MPDDKNWLGKTLVQVEGDQVSIYLLRASLLTDFCQKKV